MGHSQSNGGDGIDSTPLAQPMLPGSIMCFGATGVYRINLENGSCQKAKSGNWSGIRSAIRDPEEDVVYAFGTLGLYKVSKDGSYTKVQKGNWTSASDKAPRPQTAFYLGGGQAVYVGANHIYSLNLREGTYGTLGPRGYWAGCNCVVYATDRFAYAFGSKGVYKIKVDDGTSEKLCSGYWSAVDCGVQISEDIILCFGGCGIFHLNIKDGRSTKIASGAWGGMHSALADAQSNAVFAFGTLGIYKVSPEDGSYEKVLRGNWGTVHGGVYDPMPMEME